MAKRIECRVCRGGAGDGVPRKLEPDYPCDVCDGAGFRTPEQVIRHVARVDADDLDERPTGLQWCIDRLDLLLERADDPDLAEAIGELGRRAAEVYLQERGYSIEPRDPYDALGLPRIVLEWEIDPAMFRPEIEQQVVDYARGLGFDRRLGISRSEAVLRKAIIDVLCMFEVNADPAPIDGVGARLRRALNDSRDPDEHPEDRCEECRRPFEPWHAPTEEWAQVTSRRWGGPILCRDCFDKRLEVSRATPR